jgi:hypothetical protein
MALLGSVETLQLFDFSVWFLIFFLFIYHFAFFFFFLTSALKKIN